MGKLDWIFDKWRERQARKDWPIIPTRVRSAIIQDVWTKGPNPKLTDVALRLGIKEPEKFVVEFDALPPDHSLRRTVASTMRELEVEERLKPLDEKVKAHRESNPGSADICQAIFYELESELVRHGDTPRSQELLHDLERQLTVEDTTL